MGFESPTNADNTLELSKANLRKLEELMGDDFNEMEMSDFLSYLKPEQAEIEIQEFEDKLDRGKQGKEDVIRNFKGHLGYMAA